MNLLHSLSRADSDSKEINVKAGVQQFSTPYHVHNCGIVTDATPVQEDTFIVLKYCSEGQYSIATNHKYLQHCKSHMHFVFYLHIGFHVQKRQIQPGPSPGYTPRRSGECR